MKSVQALLALISLAGISHSASAQTYETDASGNLTGGRLAFQVSWNGSPWSSTIPAVDPTISNRVELRVVASYVGTRTDLYSLGEVLYQPVLSGVDNSGTTMDQIGPWRNAGNTANGNGMLTQPEGDTINPLADYGRVIFGGTATSASLLNTITSFRHSAGSDGAPLGEHIRMAGIFVSTWPRDLSGPIPPTSDDNLRIQRGISAMQQSQLLTPLYHFGGVADLVVFRQAIILSPDHLPGDVLTFSSFRESAKYLVNPAGNDVRFMTWQTSSTDSGSSTTGHRTGIEYVPGTFTIVPTPPAAMLLMLGCLAANSRKLLR